MKAKLKGVNGFARFLLAHGEKLGMAAVLAIAFLLIWKSLGRERLDANKQPTQLASRADAATSHYESMNWDSFPPEQKVDAKLFLATAGDGVMQPVKPGDFPPISSINPPVRNPIGQRTDPVLLTAEKLEVNAGSGLWAIADSAVAQAKAWKALQEQQESAKDAEEEARRMEEEEGRGRGGRGGRGRGEGRGGNYNFTGGGMNGMEMTVDNVPVMRPANAAGALGFEDIRSFSWVTVLAKIPIKDQVEKYEDALLAASGYDAQSDMPVYMGYQVERAEMTDDGMSDWAPLPNVVKKTIIDAMERRPYEMPELANQKYTHPLLTWPLPSMVLRPWGKDVTHSDLPLPTPEELMGTIEEEQPLQPEEKPGEEGADDFARQAKRESTPLAPGGAYGIDGGMGMRGGYRGGMEGGGGYRGGFEGGGGFRGGMGRGEMMGGYGMAMGRGAGGYELPEKPWDGKTKYILFRYFDNTVKPGHRYRYRVRLVLTDVNKDPIPEKYLDPTVVARKKENNKGYVMTEWSEPSPTAAVPQSGLVYVAKVNESKGFTEPDARLIVKSLDANVVAEVALAEEFMRGSVLNLLKRKASVIWSPSYQTTDKNGEPVKSPEFDILTGLTLLDFHGGEELNKSRELLAPSRALVMDATGRMSIKRELDELKPIREFDLIEQASKEAARNRQDDGRGGGGGGGGRGEGRGGGGRGRGGGRGGF